MLSTKNEKHYMNACLIAAGVNVVLNYFLIKAFHQYGAAIATTVSSIIILCYLLPRVDKSIQIANLKNVFLAPIFGSIIMGAIVFAFLRLNIGLIPEIIINVIVGAAVYGIILILFKYEIAVSTLDSLKRKMKRGE